MMHRSHPVMKPLARVLMSRVLYEHFLTELLLALATPRRFQHLMTVELERRGLGPFAAEQPSP
ncbi:MAG: hypothetical protein QNK04_04510 [Myxococcota bacterium]|nr:hypothetical protein [Myxococcota bacterium]